MKNNAVEQKEFALAQITPYFKDPSTCGLFTNEKEQKTCSYLTPDGKMCVAGKNLLPEIREKYKNSYATTIGTILHDADSDQSKVFIPEAVDILSNSQWDTFQLIHDYIARGENFKHLIHQLGVFTYEELEAYANKDSEILTK